MKATALVVDDEADIRELLEITLSRMGVRTDASATLGEARKALSDRDFDFCITDMRLPDGNGIELVRWVQLHRPRTPIAVITAHGNAQAAVDSLKSGAFDFVSKPVQLGILRKLVENALKLRSGQDETPRGGTDDILQGNHPSIAELRSLVERLARSQAPVHIHGESGTGKELVARLIHLKGPRAGAPFIPINCGAIPGELMESEFFGHLKGSFTGALRDKAGLFQAAEGGTLFLDEIGDLPLHMQVKLLRALQERAVRPVGAEVEQSINVRIISATHLNLSDLVSSGRFRQDLYYRLNVIEVQTPALRDRVSDIPALAQYILKRVCAAAGLEIAAGLDAEAIALLCQHDFPGNVRELENILERAVTLCDGVRVRAADLQLRSSRPQRLLAPGVEPRSPALGEHMEALEKRAIQEALEKTRYNKTKAAELLGLTFRQLRYKVKKLNID